MQRGVEQMRDLANEERALALSGADAEELYELSHRIENVLRQASREQLTGIATQEHILALQREKREIFARLKDELACLDKPDCELPVREDDRFVQYDAEEGVVLYEDDHGWGHAASLGQMFADVEWGVTYAVRTDTFERRTVKRYLIERAKHQLRLVLDEQIVASESGGALTSERKKIAYRNTRLSRGMGIECESWGVVAEREALTLLKRLTIDHVLPFDVRDVNLYDDVKKKIDFVIRKRDGGAKRKSDIGVQYTISRAKGPEKRAKAVMGRALLKDELDDIVVVVHPDNGIAYRRDRWIEDGRPSGGPGSLMSKNEVHLLFQDLMRDIFPKEDIDALWEQVSGDFDKTVSS